MTKQIEIAAFTADLARVRAIKGVETSVFLAKLQKANAFGRGVEMGRTFHTLEWVRIPAFIAHCAANGIDVVRPG